MSAGPHVHAWRMVMHLDSCHSFQSNYSCDCGATRATYAERNVQDDPYSIVWMDPHGEETGVEGGCARCRELLAGEPPVHSDETVEVHP